MTSNIQKQYNAFAKWYDLTDGLVGYLGVRRLRRRLLSQAGGKVLEIAVGTGLNLPWYQLGIQLTAIDLSQEMITRARKRAGKLKLPIDFTIMDGELLGFPDNHFDTVVESLTLCTFPDPVLALREMGRVVKPGGRILLLEHGRSDRPRLGRYQDRRAAKHAKVLSCNWNREPQELVVQAGLRIKNASRSFFGVFHLLEVEPNGA